MTSPRPRPSRGRRREPAETPREPWLQGDPADSVYRAAREALNRRDFRKAADLFAQIPERFPKSGYAPDAFYWQAFALYRLGGEPQLRAALDALRQQRERYAGRGDQGRRGRARARGSRACSPAGATRRQPRR